MNQKTIETQLLILLEAFLKENEIATISKIDEKTRLIGHDSIFDSIELVQFIVEVENFIDEEFNIEIQLASEKAMSRRNSPFVSISNLTEFILEEINE